METHRRTGLTEPASAVVETRREKTGHVFFFSAAHGRYSDLRGIQGTFNRELGPGRGTVYNSFFFAETPHKDRYKDMAADIKAKLAEGPVTIIGHSSGAAEAVRALFEDPEILNNNQNTQNLTLICIAPFFPKNWLDGAKKLALYGKVLTQEARKLGLAFPGKSSILSGVISAGTMPSGEISHEALIEAARLASPKLSHPSANQVDFTPTRDFLSHVDQETQDSMRARDREISEAERKRDRRRAKRALRRRGQVKKIVSSIFDGDYADVLGDPQIEVPYHEGTPEVNALRRRLIRDSLGGRDLANFHKLQNMGVNTWIGFGEQDIMMSEEKATALLQGNSEHVFSVPFATHGSPWGTQPDILIAIMKHCDVILEP